ncbi:hypothetical protein KJK32_43740 [Streptomyces sp. JCM17656]|nr:hypothetical protein KJK32_43740 [Streptomyces sp. JCM17656]
MTLLVTGSLLAGCSAQGAADGGSTRRTASPQATAPPSGGATATPVFTPDASLVPRTSKDGQRLVESVVFAPGDWGRDFVAQDPAVSRPGTWAVLDDGCRWEREKAPRGVLASLSRYSLLPAGGSKGAVKVTAVATAHSSALGADEQLSTTLEEVLRCPEQHPGPTRGSRA